MATLSISYYDLGYTTGEMAVKILKGESDVSDMPIEYTDVTKKYNKTICDDLGLTAPEGYEAIEAEPSQSRSARQLPQRGNGDDRRQRRKQGGAVGAAASRMQATAKQTLGAATRVRSTLGKSGHFLLDA